MSESAALSQYKEQFNVFSCCSDVKHTIVLPFVMLIQELIVSNTTLLLICS
jgi:hypothetical protein